MEENTELFNWEEYRGGIIIGGSPIEKLERTCSKRRSRKELNRLKLEEKYEREAENSSLMEIYTIMEKF